MVHRTEANPHPRFDDRRGASAGIEHPQRRAADELPSARTFDRVDSRLFSGHADASRRDLLARFLQSRSSQRLVHSAQVREARREAEHVAVAVRSRVSADDLVLRQSGVRRDVRHVRPEFAAVTYGDDDARCALRRGSPLAPGHFLQHVQEPFRVDRIRIEIHRNGAVCRDEFPDAGEPASRKTFFQRLHPAVDRHVDRVPELHDDTCVTGVEQPRVYSFGHMFRLLCRSLHSS